MTGMSLKDSGITDWGIKESGVTELGIMGKTGIRCNGQIWNLNKSKILLKT